jgi:hypothetical protein
MCCIAERVENLPFSGPAGSTYCSAKRRAYGKGSRACPARGVNSEK